MLRPPSANWLRSAIPAGGQIGFVLQLHPRPPFWLRSATTPAPARVPLPPALPANRADLPCTTQCKIYQAFSTAYPPASLKSKGRRVERRKWGVPARSNVPEMASFRNPIQGPNWLCFATSSQAPSTTTAPRTCSPPRGRRRRPYRAASTSSSWMDPPRSSPRATAGFGPTITATCSRFSGSRRIIPVRAAGGCAHAGSMPLRIGAMSSSVRPRPEKAMPAYLSRKARSPSRSPSRRDWMTLGARSACAGAERPWRGRREAV